MIAEYNRQPLFFTAVFSGLIASLFGMAALGSIGWAQSILIAGLITLSAFLVTIRFERDLARQRLEAERQTRVRERVRAQTFATLRSKIVQGFPAPLLLLDGTRYVIEANQPARDMFGHDIIGNDLAFYMRQPQVLEAVQETLANGRPAEREYEIKAPVERYYSVHANRIERSAQEAKDDQEVDAHAGGSEYYVVIAFQDITTSKVSDRMRVDFIANASHELRTPLSALIGFIETLQGPAAEDTAAQTRFLAIMAAEADRMIRVIDDLLSLSRIELGKHVAPRDSIDLESISNNVSQSMQLALTKAGRQLNIELAQGTPPICGDRDQLIQVFQNLITNSIKYSRQHTAIRLVIAPADHGRVRAQVIDAGDGIAPEYLARLTERFYRVDTARSRQIGGTGLGLAIVKHIVERHGGELVIESKLGVGTTISLYFEALEFPSSQASDKSSIS